MGANISGHLEEDQKLLEYSKAALRQLVGSISEINNLAIMQWKPYVEYLARPGF